MSTRTRARPSAKSYTARLQERTGARLRARQVSVPTAEGRLPGSLAVVAEVNQLVAAVVEWPGSPVRGLAHVLVAAALGVFAATAYFAPTRTLFVVGVGVSLVVPLWWVGSALVGDLTPYVDYPLVAGVGGAAVELALAGVLGWRVRAEQRR